MSKVKLSVMKPWISRRVTELLGVEDDVLINFIFSQLEEKVPFTLGHPSFSFFFFFLSFFLSLSLSLA